MISEVFNLWQTEIEIGTAIKKYFSSEYQIQGEPGQHFFFLCLLAVSLIKSFCSLYTAARSLEAITFITLKLLLPLVRWSWTRLKLKCTKKPLISIDNISSLMNSTKSGPNFCNKIKLIVLMFNMLLHIFVWLKTYQFWLTMY